jgi:peptidoglycan hydrolase CwlO-like protein
METEFVNEYINRLIANLHDLTSKNVLLETRLAMADKVVANLQVELKQAQTELEQLQSKPKKPATDAV